MSFYRFLLIHAAATRGATRPGGPAPSARRVTAPPPSGESRSRDATVPNSSADSKSRITLEFSFAPRASPIFLREDFSRTRERDSATRAPPDGRRWRKAGLETPRNSLLHSTRNSESSVAARGRRSEDARTGTVTSVGGNAIRQRTQGGSPGDEVADSSLNPRFSPPHAAVRSPRTRSVFAFRRRGLSSLPG
jgi:hypothetical protein